MKCCHELKDIFNFLFIVHRTAFTVGTGESMIAEKIIDFETSLPDHIKLAYLPDYGMVKLRLTATGDDKEEMEKELDERFSEFKRIGKGMAGDE